MLGPGDFHPINYYVKYANFRVFSFSQAVSEWSFGKSSPIEYVCDMDWTKAHLFRFSSQKRLKVYHWKNNKVASAFNSSNNPLSHWNIVCSVEVKVKNLSPEKKRCKLYFCSTRSFIIIWEDYEKFCSFTREHYSAILPSSYVSACLFLPEFRFQKYANFAS